MFKGIRYDVSEGHMYEEMKKIRTKIIQKFPNLVSSEELGYGLLSNGKLANVSSFINF